MVKRLEQGFQRQPFQHRDLPRLIVHVAFDTIERPIAANDARKPLAVAVEPTKQIVDLIVSRYRLGDRSNDYQRRVLCARISREVRSKFALERFGPERVAKIVKQFEATL